jgi:hypothetical protein
MSDGITAGADFFGGAGDAGASFGDFSSGLGGFDAPTSLFADGAGGLASAADLTSASGDWLGAFGDLGMAGADIGGTFADTGGGFDAFEAGGGFADAGGGFDVFEAGGGFGGGEGFDVFEAGWDPGSTSQAFGGATDFGGLDQAGGGTFMGTGGAAAGNELVGGGMSTADLNSQELRTMQPLATGGGFAGPGGGQSAASAVPSFGGGTAGGQQAGAWLNPDTGQFGAPPPPPQGSGNWFSDFARANPGLLIGGGLLATSALMNRGNSKTPAQKQVQAGAKSIQDQAKNLGQQGQQITQQGVELGQRGVDLAGPAQGQLQETASTLKGQAAQNSAALAGGALPMGAKAGIDQATNAAIAKIRSQFAGMGLSGSSMEASMIAQAKIAAQKQAFEQALTLADLGFKQTQAGAGINQGLSATGSNMQVNGLGAQSNGLGAQMGALSAQNAALDWFNKQAQQELQDDADLSNAIAQFASALPGAIQLPNQQQQQQQRRRVA